MLKCPFFGKPCLKEDCIAFETQDIYVGPSTPRYNKKFKDLDLVVHGECLYRIKNICHALNIEVPK